MIYFRKMILLVLMAIGTNGCSPVLFPVAPLSFDSTAKEFNSFSDKASLYIYRDQMFFGSAIPLTVMVNGKNIGHTAAQTYFWLKLIPGKYIIESYATNSSTIHLSLEAGKSYFLRQKIQVGAEVSVHQIDEINGRKGVLECKLIIPLVSEINLLPIQTSDTLKK